MKQIIHSIGLILCISLVNATRAFTIQSKSWNYKGHSIGYEEAQRVLVHDDTGTGTGINDVETVTGTSVEYPNNPILLLNGFGVGSFHQHRLMPNLISVDEEQDDEGEGEGVETTAATRKVYAIDYLGQGRSWPVDCDDGNSENERGLIYSIDTWADQIIEFIEAVILRVPPKHDGNTNAHAHAHAHTKVHLIGNSVGGHLSVLLAAKRPDLIDSICLLNATPVWGLNLMGWSGHLPAPFLPKMIGRYLFDKIRDLDTIEKYLEGAYANRNAFDETLVRQF